MRRTGSAPLNSCPLMIQRLGCLLWTSCICSACAHLTNTLSLALVGDPDDNAYELLFSFSTSEGKEQFLELVRSNLDTG